MAENNSRENVRRLIEEVQGGKSDSIEVLRDLYMPLLKSSTDRFSKEKMSEQDKEELFGEALVAFCNAIYAYDLAAEGVEFGLYARICIDNALVSFLRAYERGNRILRVSLSDPISEGVRTGEVDMLDVLSARESAAALAGRISLILSKYENKIWWMYVSGISVKEIAEQVENDERSVHNAIYRIRRKLKKMLSEPD